MLDRDSLLDLSNPSLDAFHRDTPLLEAWIQHSEVQANQSYWDFWMPWTFAHRN